MRPASVDRYLFSVTDLRALFPDHSDEAFRALLTRVIGDARYWEYIAYLIPTLV